jgi:hypothetical protein
VVHNLLDALQVPAHNGQTKLVDCAERLQELRRAH